MARDRSQLQTLLENLLATDDEPDKTIEAYFQPPENVKMSYPCIVYKKDDVQTRFAGNAPYRVTKRWQVTVIDRDPDSEIPDKVAALPLCKFDRSFTVDGLNHDVFILFF